MKRLSLLVLAVFIGFAFSGCAREEAGTVQETKEEGIMSSIVSTEKPTTVASVDILMLADFNSGTKPSNIGGDFGVWDRDPADSTQTCADSFDSDHTSSGSGFSMKLDYDVDSPNPAYNGFWMKLNNLNAAGFRNLAFLVKGDIDAGYSTIFKVELKSANGEVGKFYVSGVDSKWKKISIPLNQLQGLSDLGDLNEFVIVFEDTMASNKDGVIYIDDIQLTK